MVRKKCHYSHWREGRHWEIIADNADEMEESDIKGFGGRRDDGSRLSQQNKEEPYYEFEGEVWQEQDNSIPEGIGLDPLDKLIISQ